MSDSPALPTAELMSEFVMGNYGRFPVAFERGEGSWIWDEDGSRYLDFGTGIAVCSLGHCHPAQVRAIAEQAGKLIHCSNLYQIRQQAELARFISEKVMQRPGKTFFCNSGAEADEALIKLGRKYGHDTGGPERFEIITCHGSFHGRTLGGVAATGQDKIKAGFEPSLEGFTHIPFNDADALRAAVTPRTAAVLLEIVQGEGGIHVASPEFLQAAAELRAEHGILVMLDEVQCGLGRTGDLCGWDTALHGRDVGFEPDAVSWAKGLGGGFPIGAIWTGERCQEVLGPGTHGSTFGGTPLASAAGLAVLEEIVEAELPRNAALLGARIYSEAKGWNHPFIHDVRGLGLMIGFVLDAAAIESAPGFAESGQTPSVFVVSALMKAGLLTVPAGPDVVRWLPALNVTEDEVTEALEIQKRVLDSLLPD